MNMPQPVLLFGQASLDSLAYHWFWGITKTQDSKNNLWTAVNLLKSNPAEVKQIEMFMAQVSGQWSVIRGLYWVFNINQYAKKQFELSAFYSSCLFDEVYPALTPEAQKQANTQGYIQLDRTESSPVIRNKMMGLGAMHQRFITLLHYSGIKSQLFSGISKAKAVANEAINPTVDIMPPENLAGESSKPSKLMQELRKVKQEQDDNKAQFNEVIDVMNNKNSIFYSPGLFPPEVQRPSEKNETAEKETDNKSGQSMKAGI